MVSKNVPFLDSSGNLGARKPNKAQKNGANTTGVQFFTDLWSCLLRDQWEWCQILLIVYLLFALLPQKLHQIPLFASSTLWCAPPLIQPAASLLRSAPPSLQWLASLLQLRRICSNTILLRGDPPLCFHLHRILRSGPPLHLDTLCLNPFKSLRLGPPPPHCSIPHLLLPCDLPM